LGGTLGAGAVLGAGLGDARLGWLGTGLVGLFGLGFAGLAVLDARTDAGRVEHLSDPASDRLGGRLGDSGVGVSDDLGHIGHRFRRIRDGFGSG